jgi:RHS repeat-associated protein
MPKSDCSLCTFFGDPIDATTGNLLEVEVDFEAAPHIGLSLTRTYNSMDPRSGAFGSNWRSEWQRSLVIDSYSNVTATRADGRQEYFTPYANLPSGGTAYQNDADVTDFLTAQIDASTGEVIYILTTPDDTVEIYSRVGKLLSVTTRSGLTTTLTYSNSQLVTVTGPFGHTLTFTYNTHGRIATVRGPDGRVYNYSYDAANGNLISVTHPDQTSRKYTYGNATFPHMLTSLTDELGSVYAAWTYDANGRATSSQRSGGIDKTTISYTDTSSTVSDARGNARTLSFVTQLGVNKTTGVTGVPDQRVGGKAFTYDANGFLASRTDWKGNVTKYAYDARGNETSRTEAYGTALARTTTTTWHATFNLPLTIAEPNRTTAFTYDAKGNLLTQTVTAGTLVQKWTYTYNTNSQVLTKTDPNGKVWTYAYDTKGNLASVKNPLGKITSFTGYDANGRLLSMKDPNGLVTTLTYDTRGRVLTQIEGTAKTTYTYNAAGLLTKTLNPDGSFFTYTYDSAHRLTAVKDALGNSLKYTLDLTSNPTKVQALSPSSVATSTRSYTYDSVNRMLKEMGASGQATTYTYDNNGNVTSASNALAYKTSYAYDVLNRLSKETNALSGITSYAYNANDYVTSITDPRSLKTTYAWNGLGQQTSLVSPDTGTTTKTYDLAGNVLTSTDARGKKTTYTYDALGRVIKATFADAKTVTYAYDTLVSGSNYGIGRLSKVTDSTGSTTYVYNQYGRLLTKTQVTGTLTLTTKRTYDAYGRLATMTYPSGKVITYAYNAAGQVASVKLGTTNLAGSVAYASFGGALSWTQPNAATYTRAVDSFGRITSIKLSNPATTLTYTYDTASRIKTVAETGLTNKSFAYDALDRLTGMTIGTAVTTYAYDADSNRTSVKTAAGTTAYTYPTTNNRLSKLTGLTAQTHAYDAAGNLTSDGTRAYAYDARGRMATATVGGVTTTYGINGLGQQAAKTGSAVSTGGAGFVYDEQGHLIGEYNKTGGVVQETVYLGDTPIAVLKGTTAAPVVYPVMADHLNAPKLITNSTAKAVWKWDHMAFGDNAPNQNPSSLGTFIYGLRFPGQYANTETGLSQNFFRDYNPNLGRYVQSDPIGLAAGVNTFGYVGGNPVTRADPVGLDWVIVHYESHGASNPFGHSGIGAAVPYSSVPTIGFYPTDTASGWDKLMGNPVPGIERWDRDYSTRSSEITLQTNYWQDLLIANYLQSVINQAPDYQTYGNNCAQANANALRSAGFPVPQNVITPKDLTEWLSKYQRYTPVPRTTPVSTPIPSH